MAATAPVIVESAHPFDFIVSEEYGWRSREARLIGPNQSLVPGMILGKLAITAGVSSSAVADVTNTGNGTIALDATNPVSSAVQDGAYRIVFNGATTFTVEDPRGREVGKGSTGTVYNKEVKFTITAGATPFVAGDAFTIAAGREVGADDLYVQLAPGASDGSEKAVAIAGFYVLTDAVSRKQTTIWEGRGEVRAADLVWPVGITLVQKEKAINQLRELGIKLR